MVGEKIMDAQSTRVLLLSLPHAVETVSRLERWGDELVFRVGDQATGGKMFAQIDFPADGRAILSFAAGPERFGELTERDSIASAPFRARIYWIALMDWRALGERELKSLLKNAHGITFAKLNKKFQHALAEYAPGHSKRSPAWRFATASTGDCPVQNHGYTPPISRVAALIPAW
jgi:predicted DNA-binding protein (MmcQ/YjbR family)